MKNSFDPVPSGLTATSSADNVARWILSQRLENVWRYLRQASSGKRVSSKAVHRLRVASREAQAALQVCAPLLPKRRARWMRRALRQTREAAGPVRELAVMRARLERELPNIVQSELQDVFADLDRRRSSQLRRIRRKYRRLKRTGFKSRSRQLVARIHWRSESPVPPWIVVARDGLSQVAEPFFAATNRLERIEDLHRLRLRSKRFRYALEVVDLGNAPPASKKLRKGLKDLQSYLGVVNDHATDRQRVTKWMGEQSAEGMCGSPNQGPLAIIAEHSQRGMARTEILFRQWWTDERVAGLERAWRELYEDCLDSAAGDNSWSAAAEDFKSTRPAILNRTDHAAD